jgi:hypothetical protein
MEGTDMASIKTFLAVLVVTAFALAACSHPEPKEGPAEKAGSKIDKGLEKMGEKMEDAGEKMQDKARGD